RRNPIIKEEARQIPIETKQQRGRRYHQIANQAIGSASPLTTHEIAPPHRLQKRLFLCSRPQCGHFISPDADVGGVVDVLLLEAPFLFGLGPPLSLSSHVHSGHQEYLYTRYSPTNS